MVPGGRICGRYGCGVAYFSGRGGPSSSAIGTVAIIIPIWVICFFAFDMPWALIIPIPATLLYSTDVDWRDWGKTPHRRNVERNERNAQLRAAIAERQAATQASGAAPTATATAKPVGSAGQTKSSGSASPGGRRKLGRCECGGVEVTRTNRTTGKAFIGCSNYPRCTRTRNDPNTSPRR